MWEYIVSGQLPGTQIQVNFETWFYAITMPVVIWLGTKLGLRIARLLHSGRRIRHQILSAPVSSLELSHVDIVHDQSANVNAVIEAQPEFA